MTKVKLSAQVTIKRKAIVEVITEYRYIIVELFDGKHEGSRNDIRARPLPNQWASPNIRIECCSSFRIQENIGKLYKIQAKFKDTQKAKQLYSPPRSQAISVNREEALRFIEAKAKQFWLN